MTTRRAVEHQHPAMLSSLGRRPSTRRWGRECTSIYADESMQTYPEIRVNEAAPLAGSPEGRPAGVDRKPFGGSRRPNDGSDSIHGSPGCRDASCHCGPRGRAKGAGQAITSESAVESPRERPAGRSGVLGNDLRICGSHVQSKTRAPKSRSPGFAAIHQSGTKPRRPGRAPCSEKPADILLPARDVRLHRELRLIWIAPPDRIGDAAGHLLVGASD